MTAKKEHYKPPAKDSQLNLRVNADDLERWHNAADKAKKTFTDWICAALDTAAKRGA